MSSGCHGNEEPAPVVVDRPSSDYDTANAKVTLLTQTCATPGEVAQYYDRWATAYDNDLSVIEYRGPRYSADMILHYVPDHEARILDVAAGTGLILDELKVLGHSYPNVDALDGSQKMLDLAREKGLYRKYICALMSEEPTDGLAENSYDCIVTVGSFLKGHMPPEVVHEFIRLVKPGGHVIIIMRDNFLHVESLSSLEDLMRQCEVAGRWRRLDKKLVPRYYGDLDGACFIYQVK